MAVVAPDVQTGTDPLTGKPLKAEPGARESGRREQKRDKTPHNYAADAPAEPVATPESVEAARKLDRSIVAFLQSPSSLGALIPGHTPGDKAIGEQATAVAAEAAEMKNFLSAIEKRDMAYLARYPSVAALLKQGMPLTQIEELAKGVQAAYEAYKGAVEGRAGQFQAVLEKYTDASQSRLTALGDKAVADAKEKDPTLTNEKADEIRQQAIFGAFRVTIPGERTPAAEQKITLNQGTADAGDDVEVSASIARGLVETWSKGTAAEKKRAMFLQAKLDALPKLDLGTPGDEQTMTVSQAYARIDRLRAQIDEYAHKVNDKKPVTREEEAAAKAASADIGEIEKRIGAVQQAYMKDVQDLGTKVATDADTAAKTYLDAVHKMHGALTGSNEQIDAALKTDGEKYASVKYVDKRPNGISEVEARFMELPSTKKYIEFQERLEAQLKKFAPAFGMNCEGLKDEHGKPITINIGDEMRKAVEERRPVNLPKEVIDRLPRLQKGFVMLINEAYKPVVREYKLHNQALSAYDKIERQYANSMSARALFYAAAVELKTPKGEQPDYNDDKIGTKGYRVRGTPLGTTALGNQIGPKYIDELLKRLEGVSVESIMPKQAAAGERKGREKESEEMRRGVKAITDTAMDLYREGQMTTSGPLYRNFGDKLTHEVLTTRTLETIALSVLASYATGALAGAIFGIGRDSRVTNVGGGGSGSGNGTGNEGGSAP